jgi:hypothetical protein
MMPRFAERLKRGKSEANWAPEPCYPPPCPGYEYGKLTLATDGEQENPDIGMVPAEHFGEGAEEMGAIGPPPQGPAVVEAEEEAAGELGSVINLPPPPFSFPLGQDDECPGCDTNPDDAVARRQMVEAQDAAKQIDARIGRKELLLIDHDRWIIKAQDVISQVQELIKQSHASKQAVNLQIARLKIRKQEVMREAQKAQLENGLEASRTALAELADRQTVLKVTRQVIEASKEKVNDRLAKLAKSVGISGEPAHVEEKLREWKAASDPITKTIDKMWDDYPRHPAHDKPAERGGNKKPREGYSN